MSSLFPFLIVLSVLVFIHELGHYLAARFNGVRVEIFSIGFGPELFGWTDAAGTRWKISLIPLGGYVQMLGDADAASTPDVNAFNKLPSHLHNLTLQSKSIFQRIFISFAGPFANYILAIMLLTGIFVSLGQNNMAPIITNFAPQSYAQLDGLQINDRITHVNDRLILSFTDVNDLLKTSAGTTVKMRVQRQNDVLEMNVRLVEDIKTDHFGRQHVKHYLGVMGGIMEVRQHTFFSAISSAIYAVLSMSKQTLDVIYEMIIGVQSTEQLGGPLRIAHMAGEVFQLGWGALIGFMAVLSVNLGFMNLLPIPALDGGHIFLYILEGIYGKELPLSVQTWFFRIGIFCLGGLMLLTTFNDLSSLKIFSFFASFIK